MNEAPLKVVVAGGGVAALETIMALRADAQDRVSITMLAPEPNLVYRPLSVAEPFAMGTAQQFPLERVAKDFDCELRPEALSWVAPGAQTAYTAGDAELAYDVLVICLGARRVPAFDHVVTFRGHEDSEAMHGLIQDLEGSYSRRIAFVVPPGQAWSLPIYELALLTARRAWEMSLDDVEITLVTPEERPLAVFGREASADVATLLEEAGIAFEGSTYASVPQTGVIELGPGERRLECDRIVALPAIEGPHVRGLPSDPDGFLPVARYGHVEGVEHVYAAGDATNFPIKQGGLACQQADNVARVVAKLAGADVEVERFTPTLRGVLLTGSAPRYMREEVRGGHGDASIATRSILWWPPSKVAGKYLAPYLVRAQSEAWPGQPDVIEAMFEHPPETPGLRRRAVVAPLPDDPKRLEVLWR